VPRVWRISSFADFSNAYPNHIPNRRDVLLEVERVLADDGRLILTMIGPLTGRIAHVLLAKDERTRGGLAEGERMGMTRQEVENLLLAAKA